MTIPPDLILLAALLWIGWYGISILTTRFKMKKDTTEVGFMGEIHPTACLCHPNQFVTLVFQLHPVLGRRIIGQKLFPTIEAADAAIRETVMEFAKVVIEQSGLKVDEAVNVTVAHGPAADANEQRYYQENSPHLH